MLIELTEQHAAIARDAVAAGRAVTPQQFVDGLIARYAEEEKRRAEVDSILRAGLASDDFLDFQSQEAHRRSLFAEYRKRSAIARAG